MASVSKIFQIIVMCFFILLYLLYTINISEIHINVLINWHSRFSSRKCIACRLCEFSFIFLFPHNNLFLQFILKSRKINFAEIYDYLTFQVFPYEARCFILILLNLLVCPQFSAYHLSHKNFKHKFTEL